MMWNRSRSAPVWLLLWAALAPAVSVFAARLDATPIGLRIEGFVGPKPEDIVPQTTWVVRVQGKQYRLAVTRLEVLTGNTAYFDIIAALEPYPWALTIYGDDGALQTFTQSPAGRKISMIGSAQLVQLPGLFFISSIEAVAAPTPATSPTMGS